MQTDDCNLTSLLAASKEPCKMSASGFPLACQAGTEDTGDISCMITSDDILYKQQSSGRDNGHSDILSGEPILPPCRICREKASGFHYGVHTCEACKAFFRRSLRQGTMYVCAASGACEIVPGRRNSCAACRLKKCLNSGMSKSAIKTGRYTHTMRARHLMEVRGLTESDAISIGTGVCTSKPSTRTNTLSEEAAVLNSCPAARTDALFEEAVVSNGIPAVSEKRSSLVCVERRPVSPIPDSQEMEQIIQHMTSVQLRQTAWTPEFIADRLKNEKLYLEQRALHQQIFGPLKVIGVEEYMSLYQMTGIDVDGRRELLQNSFLPFIEAQVKRYVVFVKSIPGFVQLPIKDQLALMKVSRFDFIMILSQPAFNPTEKLYFNFDGRVISIDEIKALGNGVTEEIFEIQEKLQKLNLTEEENCVLAALSVMSTDNCVLDDAELVARSHSLLLNCFLHLVETHHSEDPLFMARVASVLVELRSLREKHRRHEEQMALVWSSIVDMPPIVHEMLSGV